MAGHELSRAEFVRRRRASRFVGRQGELRAFQANLEGGTGAGDYQFLFHVRGIAGVGKTSLTRQWDSLARDQFAAVTARVDDEVHSAVEAMAAISEQLGRQGWALKGLDKQLAAYRQRRHEAELEAASLSATGAEGQEPSASVSSTVITQLGLAGLSTVPGLGSFTGAFDAKEMAQATDRLRVALRSRFRSHEDAELVLAPLRVLTPLFVRELAEVARRTPWVVLFFDTYEQTGPMLDGWLSGLLIENEYGELPLNVVVVLSGQSVLEARHWADCLDMITPVPLEIFSEDEARQLLARKGITQSRLVEMILELSGRLPVLVDTLAQAPPGDPEAIGDPADTAVERFLKWIPDTARRTMVLACALPLHLNEDIHRTAVGASGPEGYAWLRGLPFVTGHAGRCRYHQVVRTQMLRVQRALSPTQWAEDHTRLAQAFGQWREALETGLSAEDHWDDPNWRDLRLNQTYHQLCAHPRTALPDALHEITQACDHGTATLSRWAQTLVQAGGDIDSRDLSQLGRKLQDLTGESAGVIPALTLILTGSGATTATRALAHSIRGREHRDAEDYEKALTDYNAALHHDPNLARAHSGRGVTHIRMKRYTEARNDLARSVELDPDDTWAVLMLCFVYRITGRHSEALAELNRVIEREPDYAFAIANRGETYQRMERYDNALTDLNHAIELEPNTAWTIASRGETYRLTGRYDEALTDFDRAIELEPDYAFAIGSRGQTYQRTGRYDDALTDLNHAIELDPNTAWTIASRGQTYRWMGRYDDALTDFDRAIELNPNTAWTIASRGQTYRLTGRYDDALTDLNRAIELDGDKGWAVLESAVVLRLQGMPEGDARWQRAVELFAAAAAEEGADAETAGNLLVVLCGLPDWVRAQEQLEALLRAAPRRYVIEEVLRDLADLRSVLPVEAEQLDPLVHRLREALEQTTQDSEQ
ncbi:tetratricopeptide repeat protein [Streptomyces physcomitrii]|uniref:tetratricopeptide repeat protein n=1 Tax=Streptomyces physcomitrii TaxID=2724184 RepID=UPI0033D1B007